jgi:hypothetical protein
MADPVNPSIFSQILGGVRETAQIVAEYKASKGPPQQLRPDPAFATEGSGANPAPDVIAKTGMPFDPKFVFIGVVALVVILGGVAYISKK